MSRTMAIHTQCFQITSAQLVHSTDDWDPGKNTINKVCLITPRSDYIFSSEVLQHSLSPLIVCFREGRAHTHSPPLASTFVM